MISVCMPTFNGGQFIKEQVESILIQLDSDDELIISDDGSTDDTLSILKNLKDNRIKIYHHEQPKNPYKGALRNVYILNRNMENALKYAKGDFIFFADQDDIWKENKVFECLNVLNKHTLYRHNYIPINSSSQLIDEPLIEINKPNLLTILYKPRFKGCCIAFRKELLEKALPFPNFPVEYDTWLGLCALKLGNIKFSNQRLIFYRKHKNNLSPADNKSPNSFWVKLKRRFYILRSMFY